MSAAEHNKQSRPNTAERANTDATWYQSPLSRRDSLKLLAALAASSLLAPLAGCDSAADGKVGGAAAGKATAPLPSADASAWPQLTLPDIKSSGYGKDPNLIMPPKAPWPLTLTSTELNSLAILCALILPADGNLPSATELGVPTVLDEWVSAPYAPQQQDRLAILSLLQWLEQEAQRRFASSFVKSRRPEQTALLDDIATSGSTTPFAEASQAFDRVRQLTVAAYFCTPQGIKELGYQGNTAIAGEYPGPSADAYQHLQQQLTQLALQQYAYPVS